MYTDTKLIHKCTSTFKVTQTFVIGSTSTSDLMAGYSFTRRSRRD